VKERGGACESCERRGLEPSSFKKAYRKFAGEFSEKERSAVIKASKRWGEKNPSCDDVMTQELGERWSEDNPGLASYLTNYCTGIEGVERG